MTARGTAALVAVLVALAGYLWLVEARPRSTPRTDPVSPLLAAAAGEVARVELVQRGVRLLAQRGPDGAWTDADGRRWRSDTVDDLVRTLGNLAPLMTIDADPRDPSDYGLTDAAPRLSLRTSDGTPLLGLEIGERNPASTGMYVRHAGARTVLLVGSVLGWELDKLRAAAPPSQS